VKRVLVVDDEPDLVTVLVIALQAHGYPVTGAPSGAEALRELRQAVDDATPFDVLLLDIAMPGVDGWQVLREIRADAAMRDMRVVAVTGRATSAEDLARLGDAGAIFIDKRADYVGAVLVLLERMG